MNEQTSVLLTETVLKLKLNKKGSNMELKLCQIRKDLGEQNLKIPLVDLRSGDIYYCGNKNIKLEYNWQSEDNGTILVKLGDKWYQGDSIDFDFIN